MKSTPSELEDHLGFWLRKLSNQVSETFATRLATHGVSVPQWVVLRVLAEAESMPLKDIVQRVGVDQGSLSRMVERLLTRGLVTRTASLDDRRAVAISLTTKGHQLVPKLAREADENDRAFFGALPARERKQFLATVRTLLTQNGGDSTGMPLQ